MKSATSSSAHAPRQRFSATETVRRAFGEFLALPTLLIAGFLLLAAGSYALDQGRFRLLEPARALLQERVFADAQATSDLLSTIAGGIITVTSITISLLLLALQQVAGSLTAEVYDQFLRRRHNQMFFGFFIGLALYALVTLATVNEAFNPVLGATLTFLLTIIALYLLLVLLYSTINQMRPSEVIAEIQRLTLDARRQQLEFISRTRSVPRNAGAAAVPVRADNNGYVTRVDLDLLEEASRLAPGHTEFVLRVAIGSYVAFNDVIADIMSDEPGRAQMLVDRVRQAIRLERQRDLATDAGHGIEQLEMIAWTSVSTAKSDPAPGIMVIHNLRDVLARWADEVPEAPGQDVVPVVYVDTVPERLMSALESIAVVATESMQHQTFAEVLQTFSVLFPRLDAQQQARTEDLILRVLSGLGDQMLTVRLDEELAALAGALTVGGRSETARAVREARDALAHSVGKANSRATRLEAGRSERLVLE